MKRTFTMIIIAAFCIAVMASCGNNTANNVTDTTNTTAAITTAASVTTVAVTELTTAQFTSAATSNLEKKSEAASTAKVTAAKITAKKTAATTKKAAPKTTAKKTAAKATTKKAAVTTKKVGLTKADYEWAAKKANEYIETLPHAFLQPDAQGYSFEGSVLFNKTKEEVLSYTKDEIDCEYNGVMNANGSSIRIGMYVSVKKDTDGYYLALRYETWQ